MLLCNVGSRHAMIEESYGHGFAASLRKLAGGGCSAGVAPHPDTPYAYLQSLPPEELDRLLGAAAHRLFRMRCFQKYAFEGEYLVGVDATWIRSYRDEPHCDECLRQEHSTGQMIYSHAVLEAKLLLPEGLTIPLASVPICNDDPDAEKQDCELATFPRLAERLKKRFPRLSMCLVMDSLYGVGPVLDICDQNNWGRIIVFKEGRSPALYKQTTAAVVSSNKKHITLADGTEQHLSWVTNLQWNGRDLHAVFCEETKPGEGEQTMWGWITDHRPDPAMAPIIANQGGRKRWHHEEAYNLLKNGPTQQRHDFGSKGYAWYNTWLVAQLATLMLQLIHFTDIFRAVTDNAVTCFADAYRTLRGFAVRLRECVQRDAAAVPDKPPRRRIRFLFDTS